MEPREILLTIVMIAVGLMGMPLTQWLKQKLGWEDIYAQLLSGAVAVVLAFAELFLAGDLTWDMLTLANLAAVFTAVYTVASFWYGILKEARKSSK
jgi:hypothetical protein